MVNLSMVTRISIEGLGDMMLEELLALKLSLVQNQKETEKELKAQNVGHN